MRRQGVYHARQSTRRSMVGGQHNWEQKRSEPEERGGADRAGRHADQAGSMLTNTGYAD